MIVRSAARSRQRGAIGLLGATVLLMTVLMVVLAVDTGRLMLEKRRLQQQADLAALTAAQRFCDGFANTAVTKTEVEANLLANGFNANDAANTVAVSLGQVTTTNNLRSFSAGGTQQAVRVALTRTVPASLIAGGLFAGRTAQLKAQAAAQRSLIGTLAAGTTLATLDSSQSPLLRPLLNALLGASTNLSAVGYNGLATANVRLEHLRNAMAQDNIVANVGTVQELLDAQLSFGQFLKVMADAMSLSNNNATALAAIQTLRNDITGSVRAAATVRMSDILFAETGYPGADQALKTNVNAMGLIMASAMAVNRNSLLTLNVTGVGLNTLLPTLAGHTITTSVNLRVIQPPVIAVGRFGFDENNQPRTLARSAQVEAAVALDIRPNANGIIGGLLTLVASIDGKIGIGVSVAAGDAWLDHIVQCPTKLSPNFQFAIGARPKPADVRVGSSSNLSSPAVLSIGLLNLGALVNTSVDVRVGTSLVLAANNAEMVNFNLNLSQPGSLPTPMRGVGTDLSNAVASGLGNAGTGLVSTQASVTVSVCVLFICAPVTLNLGNLAGELISVLVPLLNTVVANLLEPLLKILGVSIGQVDVQLLDIDEGQGALLI